MKKLLLTLALSAATVASYGQGALIWGNQFTGFRALIFAPQTENSTLSLVGQSGGFYGGTTSATQDTPVGTQTYTGLLLSGTRYSFAVFTGPAGTLSNNLSLLASTTFTTTTLTLNGGNTLPKGTVPSQTAFVPGVTANQQAAYQIRVWDNQNGTLTSWALAEASWLSGGTAAGVTSMLQTANLGGTDPGGNVNPTSPTTSGFTSFNIYYIPEPSMFALAGLGAAAMLIFRRRK